MANSKLKRIGAGTDEPGLQLTSRRGRKSDFDNIFEDTMEDDERPGDGGIGASLGEEAVESPHHRGGDSD